MTQRTKIVCTLGPACETKEMIRSLAEAGMNVARLNFSHGVYENHAMLIKNVREVSRELGVPVAILQDLQGPKIRVGLLPKEGIELEEGKEVVFDTSLKEYTEGKIPIDYTELHEFLQPGERILLNDGRSEVKIQSVEGTVITTTVTVSGVITSHKGINVPDSHLQIRAMTEKDEEDARFGLSYGVDFIALSFVTKPADITHLRKLVTDYQATLPQDLQKPVRIIAKIERKEAVESIQAILQVVDGIMVARGDLGVELPAEKVPVLQKELIKAARKMAKPVIVATQMLDSMQENPRPTRAEVSDVANAVIDHTDAVMLSNETATGKYPVETVATMHRIIAETETSAYDDMSLEEIHAEENNKTENNVLAEAARVLAEQNGAAAILAPSESGNTARILSRYRPEVSIIALTNNETTYHQLALSWGVQPYFLPSSLPLSDFVAAGLTQLTKEDYFHSGDKVILVEGRPAGDSTAVTLLEVKTIA